MGLRTVQLEFSTTGLIQSPSAQMTKGTIVSACAFLQLRAGDIPTHAWCKITLNRDDVTVAKQIAVLAEGYVSTFDALSWDGTIPIDESTHLVINCKGFAGDIIRAVAYTIDPTIGATGFPRDP